MHSFARRAAKLWACGLSPMFGANGVAYLLRDEFTTDRAAGAVNGTAAEPGPGTRVVSDSGSRYSITGGVGSVASGSGSYGNPAAYYDVAVARAAGRLLKMKTTVVNWSAAQFPMGWSRTTTANWSGFTNAAHAFITVGSALFAVTNAGLSAGITGTLTNGAEYQLAISLRAVGAVYMIKGGSYSNWSLLWLSTTDNTATVYAAWSNSGAVFTHDSFRVPGNLWLPEPIASDGFGSAFGTTDGLGHAETTGAGSGGSGVTWTTHAGTIGVTSAKAQASALSGGVAIATVDTSKADVFCKVKVTCAAGVAGGVTRYVDADNLVRFTHNGTQAQLIKRVAGIDTTVLSVSAIYSAGAEIVGRCEGTAHRMYYNNALIGSPQTIADAALTGGTRQGIYTTNIGNTLDDFVSYAVGSGGEYSSLDNL